jgi:hypothetical protein
VTAPEPGWYADPAKSADTFRWWDGTGWTRWLSADAQAPDPSATVEPATAATPAEAVTSGPQVRASVAVAVVIGAVLLALVAVGAVTALTADRLRTGPAVDPVPPKPPAVVAYDAGSRAASVKELRAVLPGPPFTCQRPQTQIGLFSSAVVCNAVVHEDYDGKGGRWYASQIFAVVDPDIVEPGDLAITADHLADGLATAYYAGVHVTVKKRELEKLVDIAPDGKAALLTLQFHYSAKGLASKYDRVVVGVFELADGDFGTWLARNPNDAPKKFRKLLDASASTVRAQP